MFTGIVEATGTVVTVETRAEIVSLRVQAATLAADLPDGGSIAVDGCCLTSIGRADDTFTVELTPETMRRTAFGERLSKRLSLTPALRQAIGGLPLTAADRAHVLEGTELRVNLERPMRADGRFDGHIVQGHVDGVGRVVKLERLGESAELHLQAPPELARYLVHKGSICVDGVSLTVASLQDGTFSIALIPYTLDATTLGERRSGDPVNLETDVIAKYVERLLGPQRAG